MESDVAKKSAAMHARHEHVAIRRQALQREIQVKSQVSAQKEASASERRKVLRGEELLLEDEFVDEEPLLSVIKRKQQKKRTKKRMKRKSSRLNRSSSSSRCSRRSSITTGKVDKSNICHHQDQAIKNARVFTRTTSADIMDGHDKPRPSKDQWREHQMKKMRQKAKKLRRKLALQSPGIESLVAPPSSCRSTPDVCRKYERLLASLEASLDLKSLDDSGHDLPPSSSSPSTTTNSVLVVLHDLLQFQETRPTVVDFQTFRLLGGLTLVLKLTTRDWAERDPDVVTTALRLLCLSCRGHHHHVHYYDPISEDMSNLDYLLTMNAMPELVDLVVWALDHSATMSELLKFSLEAVALPLGHGTSPELTRVRQHVIQYIVHAGVMVVIVDRFEQFSKASYQALGNPAMDQSDVAIASHHHVHSSQEEAQQRDTMLLYQCLAFLETLTAIAGYESLCVFLF